MHKSEKICAPLYPHAHYRSFGIIGSGAFGTVYRGVWSHSDIGSEKVMKQEVAVKTMEDGASEGDRVKFLQEAAIMGQFNHPNIIRLLGIVAMTDKPVSFYVVVVFFAHRLFMWS